MALSCKRAMVNYKLCIYNVWLELGLLCGRNCTDPASLIWIILYVFGGQRFGWAREMFNLRLPFVIGIAHIIRTLFSSESCRKLLVINT